MSDKPGNYKTQLINLAQNNPNMRPLFKTFLDTLNPVLYSSLFDLLNSKSLLDTKRHSFINLLILIDNNDLANKLVKLILGLDETDRSTIIELLASLNKHSIMNKLNDLYSKELLNSYKLFIELRELQELQELEKRTSESKYLKYKEKYLRLKYNNLNFIE
jgi:hypothetical protein